MTEVLTFKDLQNRVYAHLRDDDREFFPSDDVKAWLNDGALDVAVRLDTTRREFTGSTDGTNVIAVPADFLKATWLRLAGTEAFFVTDDVWWNLNDAVAAPDNPVVRYFGGNLELYPTPDNLTPFVLRYTASPNEMVSDDDVCEVTVAWQNRVVAYALIQAFLKINDYYRVSLWQQMYMADMPPTPLGREAYNEGPITLGFEPNSFDIDAAVNTWDP